MTKHQIKIFFRFNKYAIVETLWSTAALVMDILMLHHWGWHFAPTWWLNVLFVFFAFFTGFGGYRAFVSWQTYKVRMDDYVRCTEMFQKHGVKKSILYNLQVEPCSQEVAKQLAEDFDVKLDKISN